MLLDIFFNALIGLIAFSNPLIDNMKRWHKIFIFIFDLLLTYLLYETTYPVIAIVLFNFFVILLFSRQNKALNGIIALVGYISSVVCNNIMLTFLEKILHIDLVSLLSNTKNLAIFDFCFLIVVFIITSFIRKLFIKLTVLTKLSKSPKTIVLIFVELLLCTTIMVLNITYARQLGYPQNTILFNSVLFFVYFILSSLLLVNIVSSTKKNLEMQQEIETAKQLQEYTETIEYHAEQMREFKHDYLNILLTLDELVHESNNQNLITYFDEQIKPTGSEVQTINTSLLALKHIDDTAVKSILYNKLSLALSKEIKVHLFLNFDITSFDIKSLDLSKVLGIFLDNAIEAASTTEEPILSVVFTKKERLSLEIGNNFSGAAPDLTQLSENGYSEKGSGRGLGLAQAEQILNQYPNILHKVNIENNIFIQSLTF